MRITNALITRDLISQLSDNSSKMIEAQRRVSTGLKVETMSDDPTAGSAIMQTSTNLRAITQYKANLGQLGSDLDAEDSALGQVTDLLTRAKELAVSQSGANASTSSRVAAAQEVSALLSQAVQIGNTKEGDSFLFGGANSSSTPPFDINQTAQVPRYVALGSNGAPQLPQGTRAIEVTNGQSMVGASDGNTMFVQTGVLQSLKDLYDGLMANSPAQINAAQTGIDTTFASVQSLVGDVGARRNQVDTISSSLDAFQANLTTVKSNLSEVDMEQAITDMVARQTAYQAAMLASSKVMGLSLVDYIR